MHFFKPVPVQQRVEVISALTTTPDTAQRTQDLVAQLGKQATQAPDRSGFVINACSCLPAQRGGKEGTPCAATALRCLCCGRAQSSCWACSMRRTCRSSPLQFTAPSVTRARWLPRDSPALA